MKKMEVWSTMMWSKPEERDAAREIHLLADRMYALICREYDEQALIGAAPIMMANDRKVVLHDLERIIEDANELLGGLKST